MNELVDSKEVTSVLHVLHYYVKASQDTAHEVSAKGGHFEESEMYYFF